MSGDKYHSHWKVLRIASVLQYYTTVKSLDSADLKLLDVIGQGGFGTVHKAIWHGTMVAAKIIPLQKDVTIKEAEIMRYTYV